LSQDEIARLFDTSLPDLLGTPGPEAKWLEEVLRHRW
jgi:hypothetical protein